MIQTLDYADNIAIIDNSTIIKDSNWIGSKKYLVMDESKDLNLSPDRIILYKAIVGDSSDCIPGVKGIGGKGFFKDFVTKIPEDIRCDDLPKLKEFLMTMNDNKVAKKVLENWDTFCTMTKLVSFRLLIEGLYSIPSRMKDLQAILDSNMNVFNENSNLMSLIPNSVTTQK